MPLFEFSCLKCRHKFEVIVFDSDTNAKICPKCGNDKTEKQFSSFISVSSKSNSTCPSSSFCPSNLGMHKCSHNCVH